MTTQAPSDPSHQKSTVGPNPTSNQALVTRFTSPQFRTQVIEILSRTANGCLQELGYHPHTAQRLADLQNLSSKFREENKKLFEDNQRLAIMAKDLQTKLKRFEEFHESRIHSLEQQITTLHKENQEVLMRERNLATGHPNYANLHEDYIRLQRVCTQLKQQILVLQKHLWDKPQPGPSSLTIPPPHPQISSRAASGGQSALARLPLSIQDPWQKQQQQQHPSANGQISPTHPPVREQQQNTAPQQVHPHISTPSTLGAYIQAQPNQSRITKAVTPIQIASMTSQTQRGPAPPTSRPSSSSSNSQTSTVTFHAQTTPQVPRVPAQPAIQGWTHDRGSPMTISPLAGTMQYGLAGYHHPSMSLPPRYQVSVPVAALAQPVPPPPYSQHQYPPQHQLQPQLHSRQSPLPSQPHSQRQHPGSAPPSVTTSPIAASELPQTTTSASSGVTIVRPPQGMPVVPIGPPGKFLPPLMGAYVTPGSPASGSTSRPASRHTSPSRSPSKASRTSPTQSTESSPIGPAPRASHSNTSIPERSISNSLQTPHLTPSSSRASTGPSDGVPEAVTPLDAPMDHLIGVVTSPAIEDEIMVYEGGEAVSTLKKRPSVRMDTDKDAGALSRDTVRKKPRLSEDTSVPSIGRVSDGETATATPISPQAIAINDEATIGSSAVGAVPDAMDEDDDGDEEDEIGPDGTRSIRYCLDAFTDEDEDGALMCLLCVARHQNGLIEQPAKFTFNTSQEERVHHFVNEHPTAWENLLYGRNG